MLVKYKPWTSYYIDTEHMRNKMWQGNGPPTLLSLGGKGSVQEKLATVSPHLTSLESHITKPV